jgi:hypothetical protein
MVRLVIGFPRTLGARTVGRAPFAYGERSGKVESEKLGVRGDPDASAPLRLGTPATVIPTTLDLIFLIGWSVQMAEDTL